MADKVKLFAEDVRNVFDKLSNVKSIYRYLMEKTAKLSLEQQAKWYFELKDKAYNGIPCIDRYTTARLRLNLDLFKLNLIYELQYCNKCRTTWVWYIRYRQMLFL